MFCTKCGANNEDGNAFCKNCGAKLVKPAVNSPVPSSSGVAQAAKAVNVKLITGLAVALVVVIVAVVGLTNRNKSEDMNDDAKATAVMEHAETIQTTVVTVDESNDAIGDIEESSKQLYSVTAEKISNDIASFQHFTINGMHSISDECYFDRDITLEELMVMTSVNRSNVNFVGIYTSSPSIIVADSAEIKDIDAFVAFCGYPYRFLQSKIEKGFNSVSECYYNVVVEDSNIDGEYKYYDGEAEKVYIKIRFLNEKFSSKPWMFEMIQSSSNPLQWLINDCWETDDNYNLSAYKLSNVDSTKEVSYPDWFTAYKDFADGYKVAFVGADSNGIPYMVRESDGLYLYNGTSVDKVEIKGVEFDEGLTFSDMKYSYDTNQLELYGSDCRCYMDFKTGKSVVRVGSSYNYEENDYFDGNGGVIDYEVYKEQEWKFKGQVPNPVSGDESGIWCEYINVKRAVEPEDVNFYSPDRAFVEYMSECGYKPLTVSGDSEWLDAYKDWYDGKDYEEYKFCFVGCNNLGVPYLVMDNGYLSHYNGKKVERVLESQDFKFNLVLNKAFGTNQGDRSCKYDLVDLNTGEVELYCYYSHKINGTEYAGNYSYNITYEKYQQILDEMNERFGDADFVIETWYDTIDEAYQAYISNRGIISASGSVSAANASEPADTALATNDSTSEYILKDSSSRYLTKDDLKGLSADDCRIARNEIYARHGRKFDDEGLQSHFNSCSWYRGTVEPGDFQETMLSDIEVANKNLIVEYEKEMGYR